MGVAARTSSAQGRPFLPTLKRDAVAALRILGLEDHELSLLVCDDAAIQRLNRDYRRKDKPTDVLSFPQKDETDGEAEGCGRSGSPSRPAKRGEKEAPAEPDFPFLLGDIVISLPTAERQARALGQSSGERLRTLMVHGLFHLVGYDHERSPAEARRMFACERKMGAALDAREKPPPNGQRVRRAVHSAVAAAPLMQPLTSGGPAIRRSNIDGVADRARNRGR